MSQGMDRLLTIVMMSQASQVTTEGEAPGLVGERVFAVFAGLFEAFRLKELYMPERGGVLVCTKVVTEVQDRIVQYIIV